METFKLAMGFGFSSQSCSRKTAFQTPYMRPAYKECYFCADRQRTLIYTAIQLTVARPILSIEGVHDIAAGV